MEYYIKINFMQMNKFENLVFDLGGVIVDIDYCNMYNEFSKIGYCNLEKDFNPDYQIPLFQLFETGKVSEEDFINSILQKCYPKVNKCQVVFAWNSLITGVNDIVIRKLPLISKEYHCYIISNINTLHLKALVMHIEKYLSWNDFRLFFKNIYLSYEVGMRKPCSDIFNSFIKTNNINISKTLYFDDSKINIESSKLIGFHSVLVRKKDFLSIL